MQLAFIYQCSLEKYERQCIMVLQKFEGMYPLKFWTWDPSLPLGSKRRFPGPLSQNGKHRPYKCDSKYASQKCRNMKFVVIKCVSSSKYTKNETTKSPLLAFLLYKFKTLPLDPFASLLPSNKNNQQQSSIAFLLIFNETFLL